MQFRLTKKAKQRLECESVIKHILNARVESNTPTDSVKDLEATSVRLTWQTSLQNRGPVERGLYGCRIVDEDTATLLAVGICNVHETLDKCECMVFEQRSKSTTQTAFALQTQSEISELLPTKKAVQLVLVLKTADFSPIAFGPWLHDHIQRSIDVLQRWSTGGKQPALIGVAGMTRLSAL